MNRKKNIAYIAPEIPALSATFVYQEILELKKIGANIKPVSIHRPSNIASSDALDSLREETFYLYEQSIFTIIFHNIFFIVIKPFKYFSVLRMVLLDAFKVGIISHAGKGLLYRFMIAASFVNYLKKNNIAHIHSNFAHIPTDIAMYSAALYGVTFSFISHANDLFQRGWVLKEKVERSKFAVTISEYNKKYLIKKGADKEKIKVIHCGVDTSSFTARAIKKLSNPILLGSLGRMVEKKGFDNLIRACDVLKKEGVKFKLQIAGGGPLKDKLELLAESLNLKDNIDFIDALPHTKVPEWIKSLDVFVLPCKQDSHGDMDGIPVVLMEAMLSGVPVITVKISGIPELVIDGETGLLCEQNNFLSIKEKIIELVNNNTLREKIHELSNLKVIEEFELGQNVKSLLSLLDENIGAGKHE